MKSKIVINNTNITIRPSSLNTYFGCSYQWARVFLTGETSIPNSRAVIGTGIHKGVEQAWQDAMARQNKDDIRLGTAIEAAVDGFREEVKNYGISYDRDENEGTALKEIMAGTEAFIEDIVPFAEIPHEVEQRLSINIDGHPIVERVSGTLDYLRKDTIADVKTSKRKTTASNHDLQQSTYKLLAVENGYDIEHMYIHNVILTKQPSGSIFSLEPNIAKAKTAINSLLDVLEILVEDKVRPEVLFRGNPSYHFCSEKYCALYKDCMFVKGEDPEKKPAQVVKL